MSFRPTTDEQYASIKRHVSSDGWRSAGRITPATIERAFWEEVDGYYGAFDVLKRLTSDGVLVESGLHEWRRAPTVEGSRNV